MRLALLSLSCLLAGQAYASFDLMLLAGSDGRVHRYDPVNNVRLGAFGAGPAIKHIVHNTSNGEVLVDRGTSLATYNASTGERLRTANSFTNWSHIAYNSGRDRYDALDWTVTGYADTINPDLSISFGQSLNSPGVRSYYRSGTAGAVGLVSPGGNVELRFWATGSGVPTITTTPLPSATVYSNIIAGPNNTAVFSYTSGGNLQIGRINSPGTLPSLTTFFPNITGFDLTSAFYVMPSHTGFYIAGKDALTSDWRVADVANLGSGFSFYSSTVVTGIGYVSARPDIVLSPEPGTMLALGAGLAVLLQRRRRK